MHRRRLSLDKVRAYFQAKTSQWFYAIGAGMAIAGYALMHLSGDFFSGEGKELVAIVAVLLWVLSGIFLLYIAKVQTHRWLLRRRPKITKKRLIRKRKRGGKSAQQVA